MKKKSINNSLCKCTIFSNYDKTVEPIKISMRNNAIKQTS